MNAATLAISVSVESRFPWLREAIRSRNWSQLMPHAFAWSPKTSFIVPLSGIPVGRRPITRIPFEANSADRLRVSCSTAAIAGPTPPISGIPVLDGVDVTVMMTPARFATIRRAARRAVRKYDRAYVSMGRMNSSTSNSANGTPWSFVFGMPTALNEMSTRPDFLDHDVEMRIDGLAVEGVDHRSFGRRSCPTDLPHEGFDGSSVMIRKKQLCPLARERACDGASDCASGSVNDSDLVFQQHLDLPCSDVVWRHVVLSESTLRSRTCGLSDCETTR